MPSTNLSDYRQKRERPTPEPFGRAHVPATGRLFVVQQHRARHLHFDLRLEIDGVLRSWAVPKGPSADPAEKRFAALVEDHPLDYALFEGRIPEGSYGAGNVIVWDRGTWRPLADVDAGFRDGKLLFDLDGYKLRGRWTLVRMKGDKGWLLIKERDQWADAALVYPSTSVVSGLSVEELDDPSRAARRLIRGARRATGRAHVEGLVDAKPMLATAAEPFDHEDWLFELKYDGYRLMIERDGASVRLRSRNGADLTAGFPEIAEVAAHLPCDRFLLDGELVAPNDRGLPDFSLLQRRAAARSASEIARAAIESPCIYYAFDLIQLVDSDLRGVPLEARKRLLEKLVPERGPFRYSEHVAGRGRDTYAAALALGLEGVVAKRRDGTYQSGRGGTWLKCRARKSDDFVILGWAPVRDGAGDLGALLLGEYRAGTLTFVGKVGSGLGGHERSACREALAGHATARPRAPVPEASARDARWVEPKLVCEVAFREYTAQGHLRHPVFLRLRPDKAADACTGSYDDPGTLARPREPSEVPITHPGKVFFPERGLTKQDLVNYYGSIAEWMLPYLADRPIVLTRYPDGIHGKSFFQRDAPGFVPEWIDHETVWSESSNREIRYFIVRSGAALRYLANLGTIPIHMMTSRRDAMHLPDWCVLDLDPKGAPFADVIRLARAIGELADELGVPSYPKTSGASGMHVLLPLARQLTHEQSKTLAELIARIVVARHPAISTVHRSLPRRLNRVYVDHLQNGHGKLIVAPFSVRAEAAATVSMPVDWREVNGRLSNARFHIGNARARLRRLGADPMRGLLDAKPDLPRALARLHAIARGADI